MIYFTAKILESKFIFEDSESSVSQLIFPLFHFFFIESLKPGHPSDSQFSSAELKFLLDEFILLDDSLSSVVFGFSLEPVGSPGDTL